MMEKEEKGGRERREWRNDRKRRGRGWEERRKMVERVGER